MDKFNTSSGYFNDICYTTTTDDGTDISLKDRKNEYIEGDYIICQDDCEFSAYNFEIKKAKCECLAKDCNSSFADMVIDKNKLFANLRDIKNLVNLNILVCYKKFLSLSNITHNVGSLIIICIIIFHIFTIFIFYINQLSKIKKKIKVIIFGLNNITYFKGIKALINYNINKKNNTNIKIVTKAKKFNKINNSKSKLILSKNKINKNLNINIILYNKHHKKDKNILKYNNEELNELSYNLALIYDKRKFCKYYSALLKTKHNLIFSFCNSEDYNPRIIMMDLNISFEK